MIIFKSAYFCWKIICKFGTSKSKPYFYKNSIKNSCGQTYLISFYQQLS